LHIGSILQDKIGAPQVTILIKLPPFPGREGRYYKSATHHCWVPHVYP